MSALDRLGYVQGPPGMWHHTHYLDGWPVVCRQGDLWTTGAGLYRDPLDAIEAASTEPRQLASVRAERMRRDQDNH